MNEQEKQFNFTFNVNQINTIIAGLDELPHKFSRGMIDDIQNQIQRQSQPKPEGPLSSKVI
jgi:hypothetical protein